MLSGISIAFVQPAMIPRQSLGSMLLSVKKEIAMARFLIRGAAKKKTVFFWEISPKCGWVGWLTPKQGPNPSPPHITPKIAFSYPNFTFLSPKSHKNPGVDGWVNTFGKDLRKKTFFLYLP